MTDEELTAWLRDLAEALGKEAFTRAADRIETLGRACTEWAEVSQSNYQRAKETQAKLAKAVAGLRKIADYTHIGESGQGVKQHAEARIARAVLAELEVKEEATGTAWRGRND